MDMQEKGGEQAIQAQRNAFNSNQQQRQLEQQNKDLNARLEAMENNAFNQTVDFALSQNQTAVANYEAVNGEGSFRQFVSDYNFMQKNKGQNLSGLEAVNGSLKMLGLANVQAQAPVQSGTTETQQVQAEAKPQVSQQPESLPNVGTGSNVSMVQQTASNWEDWKKSIGGGF